MRRITIIILLFSLFLHGCDEVLDEFLGNSYDVTIINRRRDVVLVDWDGEYKGDLNGYGSKLEFTTDSGDHRIELWSASFFREKMLIGQETIHIDNDMTITIEP